MFDLLCPEVAVAGEVVGKGQRVTGGKVRLRTDEVRERTDRREFRAVGYLMI